jgi:SNF2 family DNA or RNA helicase
MRTYGSAELKDGYWHVTCEPHVMLRLKRMFGRVSKDSFGTAKIKATDEISRDLLWFTQRFPLEVTQRDELDRRARKHVESCEAFDRLVRGEAQPQTFDLAIPPRDYQRVAASLMLEARGLLLGDEVGVGKTLSVIAALTDPRTRPALVVTLTHLPTQWEREFKRFCPRLRTHVIKKGTPYDVRGGFRQRARKPAQSSLIEPEFPDVLIINYHKLAGWAEALAGVVRSVSFDEIQELRRSGTRREPSAKYEAAKHIATLCDFRFGASATPIYNYGGEFYNVLSVLRPDALGERQEFLREWCSANYQDEDKSKIKDPKAFGAYLREAGLMLRRTRKDVARELPPITRGEYHVDADEDALKDAEDAASELARIILSKETGWEAKGQATRDLDWKLRQATGIAKAPYVASFVKMLVESGESVVVYAWHRAVHALLADRLKDFNPVMFTGEETPRQKEASRDTFCKGESKVLLMSLRAGAGLDGLQYACRTVVFAELDWSHGVHHQAEGRVFRDGQPDPVSVYYLVSDSGSDPFLSETLGLKRGQLEGVIDPDAELVTKLSSNAADGIRRLAESYLTRSASRGKAAS